MYYPKWMNDIRNIHMGFSTDVHGMRKVYQWNRE